MIKRAKKLFASSLEEKVLKIILNNTKIEDECIIYSGKTSSEYVMLYWEGETYYLHKLIASLVNKVPYSSKLLWHHTCEHKHCLNSSHLIQMRRSAHISLHNFRRFCPRGHDTILYGRDKKHNCKECRRLRNNLPV